MITNHEKALAWTPPPLKTTTLEPFVGSLVLAPNGAGMFSSSHATSHLSCHRVLPLLTKANESSSAATSAPNQLLSSSALYQIDGSHFSRLPHAAVTPANDRTPFTPCIQTNNNQPTTTITTTTTKTRYVFGIPSLILGFIRFYTARL